ncbi:toxin regulator [Jeotgalibacillus proteolyticus]|uniref:Toxin regulator n=1 Tax=Jeotgalibacillus proteolyticus TaxID=2082395 RepID=A0A2S5GC55_9BACL|nr:toxin regulator [Jeotgalibacillus proteolyticus]PPA70473.1 toxin regulator [Jeotgalibacillus proteolyticus]
MKKYLQSEKAIIVYLAIVSLGLLFYSSSASEAASKSETSIVSLEKEIKEKQKEISSLSEENELLKEKVEQAKPWFDLSEKEQQKKIDEQKAAEEKEKQKKAEEEAAKKAKEEEEARIAAEKKAAEEAEAQRKAEEEERIGYDTGITYDQLARTPDDYSASKVKFSGQVVQVIEGDGITQIRFAVNENYDNILLGEFDSSITDSRILEDDVITIMGLSDGLITYESTMGGDITIPSVLILKIEQ